MKYLSILLTLVFFLIDTRPLKAQTEELTPNYLFDTLFDNHGNKYPLANLSVGSGRSLGSFSGGTISSISASCQSGYFSLYFEASSIFSLQVNRDVACRLFSDVSNFIISNVPGGTIKVYCGHANGPNLADATPLWLFPANPINPNQGSIDPVVYKALVSGKDPYNNIPINWIPNNNGFYHLLVGATSFPTSTVFAWNSNLTTTSIGSNDFDLYSALLHETMHGLGVFSLINYNGLSYFGAFNNYYSRYDSFLADYQNNPLLIPTVHCALEQV